MSAPSPARRVLLVDDDPDVLEAMSFALESANYAVSTARNGLEALERLREGPRPGVILLDLMMPVMNGWEFRAEQRRNAALASIPLVVVTGAGHTAETSTIEATCVLNKPVTLDSLLATVGRYCQR